MNSPIPTHKLTDIDILEDPLAGTSVNLDEEERILTTSIFYAQQGPLQQDNHEGSTVKLQRKAKVEADFSAGRWAQHPLWDAFLQGDTLVQKLDKCSHQNSIKMPNDGLFYASKAQSRPQITRVIGHDGASQIIITLLSLAAKEQVTGLIDYSARLACERRDHSSGRIPTDWKMVASASPMPLDESQSAGTQSLKRELFLWLNLLTC